VPKGEAEIGMQQINVILPVAGADYVGPLPAKLQGYVDFAVGVLAVSKQPDAAQAPVKLSPIGWQSFQPPGLHRRHRWAADRARCHAPDAAHRPHRQSDRQSRLASRL
jgi:hypothetical protein